MLISFEGDNCVCDGEYFITPGVYGYEVYNCGTDAEEAKEQFSDFSDESFEVCLRWVYNKLYSLPENVTITTKFSGIVNGNPVSGEALIVDDGYKGRF